MDDLFPNKENSAKLIKILPSIVKIKSKDNTNDLNENNNIIKINIILESFLTNVSKVTSLSISSFGDNIFIGPNCSFYTPIHPIDAIERNSYKEYAKQIIVGNNVWFGGNVTVLPNVKIGSNVVIGAGSVVTKDIPDNVVALGNPCKVIRSITEDDKIFNK